MGGAEGQSPLLSSPQLPGLPNSTAEHNSPGQFHPPGTASWVRTGPIQGRVLGFGALKFFCTQVCWLQGPSQVRICLGLAHKSNEDSKGQLLILCTDLTQFGCVAAAASRPRLESTGFLMLSPLPYSLSLCSLSLSPLSFSLPSSTPDAQFTESVVSRHSGGSGWSTAQAMAQPPGLRSGQLRLAETATACISEASPGALSQLSRALSLGPLRLCFLLSLGSYWEEQGQVPGKSPKMPGSFLVACRGPSGLLPGIPVCSSSSQSLCRSWCWWGGQA